MDKGKPPADGPKPKDMERVSARQREGDLAGLAEKQHGLLTMAQLERAGLTEGAVHQRLATGRLYRVQQGVYSVGHRPLNIDAMKMAAVLACGPDAVLSHGSAAALWRLRAESGPPFDVIAPNRRGRSPVGVRAHRDGTLQTRDRASVRGIPCTTVARTLLDLAASSHISDLKRVVSEAEVQRLLDIDSVRATIAANRGRRGVARLRLLVDESTTRTRRSRSQLERRFLDLCDQAKVAPPEVNCELNLGGRQLSPDFLWRERRLIVETDGREAHDTASAFEEDRRRDQIFALAGWQVLHFTWNQVVNEPARVTRALRQILGRRA